MCARRSRPLLVGSTKGQFGHGEASSGMLALCKVIIAMETGTIPATLNYEKPNPALRAIVDGRLEVVSKQRPLEGSLVALNNFGVGNIFGHALLRANPRARTPAPQPQALEQPEVAPVDGAPEDGDELQLDKPMPLMILVSARNDDAIKMAIEKVRENEKTICPFIGSLYWVVSV